MYKVLSESDEWCQKEALHILIKVTEPIMPHLAEECWHKIGHKNSIIEEKWPEIYDDLLNEEECTIVIQINGKKRAEMQVPIDTKEDIVYRKASEIINVKNYIKEENLIIRKIFIPNKILNIVIKL